MNEERESYDLSATIYSPDGRMYQVEYAREAVKKGSISLGMIYKSGVMLMVEKRLSTKLIVPDSIEKIFKIEYNIACSTSGLVADARILADYAREELADFRIKYDEEMSVLELVKRISNIKRIYTQYGGIRPFGVSFLIGGIDNDGISLFETDPSGAYKQYHAGAIGVGKAEVDQILENHHNDNQSLKQAIHLAFRSISEVLEKNIDNMNIEVVTITEKQNFKKMSEDDINGYKKSFAKSK